MIRRRVPIARSTKPIARTEIARSQKPIARESQKRRQTRRARQLVLDIVRARDGDCVARDLVPKIVCAGRRDVHEIQSRAARPGGELDASNCVLLCRAHHDWSHAEPYLAHALGLRRWSWEVDRDAAEQISN
jgi:hypothetical protein